MDSQKPARMCKECGQALPLDAYRSQVVHKECAKGRNVRAMRERRERLKNPAALDRVCPICNTTFRAEHHREVYDTDECRRKGLQDAVRRQSERRLQAKEQREQSKRAGGQVSPATDAYNGVG